MKKTQICHSNRKHRVDKEQTFAEHAYDIEVDVEDPIKQKMNNTISTYMPNHELSQKISQLDEEISQSAVAVRNAVIKRDFLDEFSKDSAAFIKNWINSQSRDLDLILGTEHANVPLEEMRRADFYRRDWVQEGEYCFHRTTVTDGKTSNNRRRVEIVRREEEQIESSKPSKLIATCNLLYLFIISESKKSYD